MVAKDDESCTANGKLTFIVGNTTAGETMLFTVYHLPDTEFVQAGEGFDYLLVDMYLQRKG